MKPLNRGFRGPGPKRPVTAATLPHAFGAMVHGPPGVGKSSLAANAPDCFFIHDPQERGIHNLLSSRNPPCPRPIAIKIARTFEELLDRCEEAAGSDAQNVALDSMTGMQMLCFHEHCKKYFDDDWSKEGFYAYFAGPKQAATRDWPRLISALNTILDANKNVFFLAHTQAKNTPNPSGSDFEQFQPYAEKEIWGATHRWASMVLFYNFEFDIDTKGLRKKVKDETQKRLIFTEGYGSFIAKNQYGLEPIIECGETAAEAYAAFAAACRKAIK